MQENLALSLKGNSTSASLYPINLCCSIVPDSPPQCIFNVLNLLFTIRVSQCSNTLSTSFPPPFTPSPPAVPSNPLILHNARIPIPVLDALCLRPHTLSPTRILHPRLPANRASMGLHNTLHPPRRSATRSSSASNPLFSFCDEELGEEEGAGSSVWGGRFIEGLAVCGAVGAESYGECVVFFGCWEGW